MQKAFILSIFLLVKTVLVTGQPVFIKNQFAIVNRGIPEPSSSHTIEKYFNACKLVGDYYFKIKQFTKAIDYYYKVASLPLDGHEYFNLTTLTVKARLIYKEITTRMGDMHLRGLGLEKSNSDAVSYYAILPSPFSSFEINQFSKKVFGDTIAVVFANDKSNDSVQLFYINPLYISDAATVNTLKKNLEEIAVKLSTDLSLQYFITISVVTPNESAQSASIQLIERMLQLFPAHLQSCFTTDLDFSEDVYFEKKGVKFYVLELKKGKLDK